MSFLGGLLTTVVGGLFQRNSAKAAASASADLNAENRKFNHDEAKIQRNWEAKQDAKVMQFNAAQAALNRTWEETQAELAFNRELEASNTAHQREVEDLRAAGLNPILSANNGATGVNAPMATASAASMSSVPSGAVADSTGASNTSAPFDIVPILNSALNYDIQDRQLDIEQQKADNDSRRVHNEEALNESVIKKTLKETELLEFTKENTQANTDLAKGQLVKIVEDINNNKELTKAQVNHLNSVAYASVLTANAQANLYAAQARLADSNTDINRHDLKVAREDYDSALRNVERVVKSDETFLNWRVARMYIDQLNPFQAARVGNFSVRKDGNR